MYNIASHSIGRHTWFGIFGLWLDWHVSGLWLSAKNYAMKVSLQKSTHQKPAPKKSGIKIQRFEICRKSFSPTNLVGNGVDRDHWLCVCWPACRIVSQWRRQQKQQRQRNQQRRQNHNRSSIVIINIVYICLVVCSLRLVFSKKCQALNHPHPKIRHVSTENSIISEADLFGWVGLVPFSNCIKFRLIL